MTDRFTSSCILLLLLLTSITTLQAQEVLTLPAALDRGVNNYGSIKSKGYQVQSSANSLSQTKRDYLPNVVLSAQQVYGTVNGQNGPLYGFGGFAVASSGLPLPQQNWNAAFGALYLANVNWEFFTFGRVRSRIRVADASVNVAQNDLQQEQFQHQVRIASAYLTVLGAQRLALAQQKNFDRALVVQHAVKARAQNGLVAGVDSTLANAEVAGAQITLLKARDAQQEEEKKLAFLMGDEGIAQLDSTLVSRSPVPTSGDSVNVAHPVLNFYRSRVEQSLRQEQLSQKGYYPSLNFVGIIQTRGSGFDSRYAQDQTAYTTSYGDGVKPTRSNYLLGVGLIWNLTTIARTSAQVKSVHYQAMASQADFDLATSQLNTQAKIADAKLANALQIQLQTPVQVLSATNAYNQKSVLYRNGLTTLVDLTQTLYALNRAETDRELAVINVWQALLMKAAATGDLTIFTNELSK